MYQHVLIWCLQTHIQCLLYICRELYKKPHRESVVIRLSKIEQNISITNRSKLIESRLNGGCRYSLLGKDIASKSPHCLLKRFPMQNKIVDRPGGDGDGSGDHG